MLGLVDVDVTERGSRAEVKTVYPSGDEMRRNNRRNVNVSVAYTVSAPAGTRLTAGSVSGTSASTDIKGDLQRQTRSAARCGSQTAGGCRSAKSVSGNVEITRHADRRRHRSAERQRHVVLRKVKARQIDASSVSGDVTIEDVQCERVESALGQRQRRLRRHAGEGRPLRAQLAFRRRPHDARRRHGLRARANSFSGSIRSDLPLKAGPATRPGRRRRHSAPRRLWRRQRRPRHHHLLRQHRHLQALTVVACCPLSQTRASRARSRERSACRDFMTPHMRRRVDSLAPNGSLAAYRGMPIAFSFRESGLLHR